MVGDARAAPNLSQQRTPRCHRPTQAATKEQMQNLIRVFPRRTSFTPTDELAFVGDPPLILPNADTVHISICFTWDIREGNRLRDAWAQHYPNVHLGGPAIDINNTHAHFCPGVYIKPGVTFTTRGCNNQCPWCLVPREGRLTEIKDFAPGHIIQDNNLLQANHSHINRVLAMLKQQKRAVTFSGGLQASLVTDSFVDDLRSLHINQVFLAADTDSALKPLERAISKLAFLGRRRLRVYTMIGYGNKTPANALERLEAVWQLGGLPFAQLYQPPDHFIEYPATWKQLARTWSRPAAMFTLHPKP
jgi:hypothetical protein